MADDYDAADDDYYGTDYDDENYGTDYEENDGDDDGGSNNGYNPEIKDEPSGLRDSNLPYSILSEEEICRRQQADVVEISSVLALSAGAAISLLLHYTWNVQEALDAWYGDEEGVREKVGLFDIPARTYVGKRARCPICLTRRKSARFSSVSCGHRFCSSCWERYISVAVQDRGPGCLSLRCPSEFSCKAAVDQDKVYSTLTSGNLKAKYSHYLIRSYIEGRKKVKWCPAPDCSNAVEHDNHGDFNVKCNCNHYFCWKCTDEAHRPVDCSTADKWAKKNSCEGENSNWIEANTKPCPKCKRRIEKNQGCMHMVCSDPCKFHFCWLCLGPWSEHGEKTGGYYDCNIYKTVKVEKGYFNEEDRERERLKAALDRYAHYYERWQENHRSRLKAVQSLQIMKEICIPTLTNRSNQTHASFNFILDAWNQIVECRRVLRWTYVYGYYLWDMDNETKMTFFQYLQGLAESSLEQLHHCVESKVNSFLEGGESLQGEESHSLISDEDLHEFRIELSGYTNATNTFFGNLARALENNLREVWI